MKDLNPVPLPILSIKWTQHYLSRMETKKHSLWLRQSDLFGIGMKLLVCLLFSHIAGKPVGPTLCHSFWTKFGDYTKFRNGVKELCWYSLHFDCSAFWEWLVYSRKKIAIRCLRFSLWWRLMSWPSGLWRHVVLWRDINVSEGHAACIFSLGWNVGIFHTTTRCHSEPGQLSQYIANDYGLDSRMIGVRFPAGAGNFSRHRVQTGSGAHPASYPRGSGGFFPGSKAAGAWSWPLTSIQFRSQIMRGAIPPLHQYVSMAWCLVKHSENFYLYI